MSCCDVINGGAPADVNPQLLCGTPICINVTTTNAAVQTIPIGTVGARGSHITYSLVLAGVRADNSGDNGLYFGSQGNAARNGANGFVQALAVGPTGYVDPVFAPWTTIVIPAGWAAAVGFNLNTFQLTFNGAAGMTVHWRGIIWRWAGNGATLA